MREIPHMEVYGNEYYYETDALRKRNGRKITESGVRIHHWTLERSLYHREIYKPSRNLNYPSFFHLQYL